MIHALPYEPQGQHQRFEPREQRSDGWHKHIHLHLHVHLNLAMRGRHASHSPVARMTTIFAACMGALSMALTLYLQQGARTIPMQAPLFNLAGNLIFSGAIFALVTILLGGTPLVISAWRSTPRSRFLLLIPLLTLSMAILYLMLIWFVQQMTGYDLNNLGPAFNNVLLALPFYGVPILSTIGLNRAMRRATLPDEWLHIADWLSFFVVLGRLLMLTGVILWGFALALFAPGWFVVLLPVLTFPWNSWLLICLGMLIAVIVAVFALFSQAPVPQPRSHDELPFD